MKLQDNGAIDLDRSELEALVDAAIRRQGPPLTVKDEDETMDWLNAMASESADPSSKRPA